MYKRSRALRFIEMSLPFKDLITVVKIVSVMAVFWPNLHILSKPRYFKFGSRTPTNTPSSFIISE